jgi:hypothetical protein
MPAEATVSSAVAASAKPTTHMRQSTEPHAPIANIFIYMCATSLHLSQCGKNEETAKDAKDAKEDAKKSQRD